jgi:phosphatidylglycerophosphate synthase
MQAVLAIPSSKTLQRLGRGAEFLKQEVAGVPLLERVLATAGRAGVDSILVIWPDDVKPAILRAFAESSSLGNGARVEKLSWTNAFDPTGDDWASIAGLLEGQFLWLPWNWVTHKRALAALPPSSIRPATWERPVLLKRDTVLHDGPCRVTAGPLTDGVSVTSPATIPAAERFLVANSGKPTDGIYSNFNRLLCRPFVRLFAHTPTTPNQLTLAGLMVAILGALVFARGSYVNYVTGALLFFVSGLFDEMDGMIARIKFRESAFGTWFEGLVDNVTYLAVFVGIIAGLHREYGSWAWKWGAALIVGCVLSVAVIGMQRKLATSRDRPHEYAGRMNQLMEADSSNFVSTIVRQVHIFVKKGVLVHYLLLFTLLGLLHMFLWLAAVGSNLTWIIALYFTRRFFSRPPLETTGKHIQTA